MTVTAKVIVNSYEQETSDDGAVRSARVGFVPDYSDGRNKAWAAATPHLQLNMTLNGDVAGQFLYGERYTLVFEKSSEEPEPLAEQPEANPFREDADVPETAVTEEDQRVIGDKALDENEQARDQWPDEQDSEDPS